MRAPAIRSDHGRDAGGAIEPLALLDRRKAFERNPRDRAILPCSRRLTKTETSSTSPTTRPSQLSRWRLTNCAPEIRARSDEKASSSFSPMTPNFAFRIVAAQRRHRQAHHPRHENREGRALLRRRSSANGDARILSAAMFPIGPLSSDAAFRAATSAGLRSPPFQNVERRRSRRQDAVHRRLLRRINLSEFNTPPAAGA